MILILTLCFSWFISLLYIFIIFRLHLSWDSLSYTAENRIAHSNISILIAIRNEEKNIHELLDSIALQNYNKGDFETIIIDDQSEDQTAMIVQEFQNQHPELAIKLYALAGDKKGKKEALKMAYGLAKYDIIACTDGDCLLPKNWLSLLSKSFENPNKMLISGGVYLTNERSFLDYFQSLELLSLVGSGAAAIGMGRPIMCNGANMAFRKILLDKVKRQKLHSNLASGDDVFLLMECKRVFGSESIGFIKDKEHWVQTSAVSNMTNYLNQRIRWVSKSASYSDYFQIFLSFLILFQNTIIVGLIILSIINSNVLPSLLMLFILKTITDFFFLRNITSHLSKTRILSRYPLISLTYPFFIIITAIAGQVSSFQWKGRSYKK